MPLSGQDVRLAQVEDQVKDFRPMLSEVAVLKTEYANLNVRMAALEDAVRSLRAAVVGAALTVAISAIGFTITALALH